MAEQKSKLAVKKVDKPKTGKGSAVAGKPKIAKAAPKPAAKKSAAKKTAGAVAGPKKAKPPAVKKVAAAAKEKKAPAKRPASAMSKTADSRQTKMNPTPEERYRMVELAAYFIAEQHGFQGRSDEHWAAAEHEIAAKLGR